MAAFKSSLENILAIKNAIKSVLTNKGIDMTDKTFSDYPDIIAGLSNRKGTVTSNFKKVLKSLAWTDADIKLLENRVWWIQEENAIYNKISEFQDRQLPPEGETISPMLISIYTKNYRYGDEAAARYSVKLVADSNDMSKAFKGQKYVEYIPAIDVTATDMESCFEDCKNLKFIPTISAYSTNNYKKAFKNCASLVFAHIPLSGNCESCFENCYTLESYDAHFTIPDNVHITPVSNAKNMFKNCCHLHTVGELDLENVTDTTGMFDSCYLLTECKIKNLSANISLVDCAHLSKASLLYLINNCSDDPIEIKLSKVTYKNYDIESPDESIDEDIKRAWDRKPNLTIVSQL